MDGQPTALTWDDLDVVGSTIIPEPDDLPRLLSPIYRHRADGAYFLPLSEEGEQPDASKEDAESIREMAEAGDAVLWEGEPIPARRDHWLLQIRASARPEYLPSDEARRRLREIARQALADASSALCSGDQTAAEKSAWGARHANSQDPLALMVLCHLLRRRQIPADELRILEGDLEEFTKAERDAALRRARHDAELAGIYSALAQSKVTRKYLDRYQPDPGYLERSRGNYSTPAPPPAS